MSEWATRREMRAWLVENFRAEVDLLPPRGSGFPTEVPVGQGLAATRCCRCHKLLDLNTVTVDRIIPGLYGGKYTRHNIQPACKPCNSAMGSKRRRTMRAFGTVKPMLRAKGMR
jgi:hypothetical protein